MSHERKPSVLFVCMGNICRSPTAEAVFRAKAVERDMLHSITIDSAGTHAYHIGKSPDQRSRAVAVERGIDMDGQRARRVSESDFTTFDYIVAMDRDNLRNLEAIRPADATAMLSLMLSHDPQASYDEVPDPYYGGARGFEQVFDMIDSAAGHLLARVIRDTAGEASTESAI